MNKPNKLMGLLIVFLMVMTVAPMTVEPTNVTQIAEVNSYEPSETYTWQTFNRDMNVTTFVSPDGSKDELWHFMNEAEESIYVEIYGINHPHIIELIHEISTAKPSLDMKFLLGWNSLGYYSENDYVANNLTQLGYDVKWTNNSDFTFAHQKFMIIDNKTTVVHAGNWAKTSFPDFEYKANREWSIAMTDTEVTSYYRDVFDGDWLNGTDYNATLHGIGSPLTQPTTTSTYQSPFATAGEFSGPMNVTPIFSPDTSLQGILHCINIAQYTLDIQIPYFTSVGDGNEVDTVIDAILDARERGVTVRVISDEEKDFEEIAHILVQNDIPIVWQDTRWFTANHNKGIIVDGRIVLISSINYSDGSIASNREAGVIIENEEIAQWYQEVYDFDWQMADADHMNEINIYWEPNIPSSSDTINVSVYGQRLYSTGIDDVILGVDIDGAGEVNHTITANIYNSVEDDLENYFYEISPQADGTNISVRAFINCSNTWHTNMSLVIHVVDEISSGSDDTPPDISSPDDVEYEVGTTGNNITWIVTDLNPVNYTITGTSITPIEDDLVGTEVVLDIDELAIGSYTYTLWAMDTYGNVADDSVDVEVVAVGDSDAPVISSPDDIEYELGSTGNNITWTVTDDNPHNYTISRDGIILDYDSLTETIVTIDIDGLDIGVYEYRIFVIDDYDNFNSDEVIIEVVDTTDPIISSPEDVEFELGSSPDPIVWSVSDLSLGNYTISWNGSSNVPVEYDGSPTISVSIGGLEVGVHIVEVILFDVSGNFASDSVMITVVDTTNPEITGPDDFEFIVGTTGNTLTWAVSDLDPSNYNLTMDGEFFDIAAWDGDDIVIDLDSLQIGEYEFVIIVYDQSGNSASDTVTVTVVEGITNETLMYIGIGVIGVIVVLLLGILKKK